MELLGSKNEKNRERLGIDQVLPVYRSVLLRSTLTAATMNWDEPKRRETQQNNNDIFITTIFGRVIFNYDSK